MSSATGGNERHELRVMGGREVRERGKGRGARRHVW